MDHGFNLRTTRIIFGLCFLQANNFSLSVSVQPSINPTKILMRFNKVNFIFECCFSKIPKINYQQKVTSVHKYSMATMFNEWKLDLVCAVSLNAYCDCC